MKPDRLYAGIVKVWRGMNGAYIAYLLQGKARETTVQQRHMQLTPLAFRVCCTFQFVAHPQCQAQIGELWFSGVPFLRYLNRFLYLMLAIPVGLVVCPMLSMMYLIAPWSRVSG